MRVAQLHSAVVAVVFKGGAVALGVGERDRQAVGAVAGGGGAIRRTTVRSFPQTVVRPLFLAGACDGIQRCPSPSSGCYRIKCTVHCLTTGTNSPCGKELPAIFLSTQI